MFSQPSVCLSTGGEGGTYLGRGRGYLSWLGGYLPWPGGGGTHIGRGSIGSTCYVAGGMPLAGRLSCFSLISAVPRYEQEITFRNNLSGSNVVAFALTFVQCKWILKAPLLTDTSFLRHSFVHK